jgi:hypothetical protein
MMRGLTLTRVATGVFYTADESLPRDRRAKALTRRSDKNGSV